VTYKACAENRRLEVIHGLIRIIGLLDEQWSFDPRDPNDRIDEGILRRFAASATEMLKGSEELYRRISETDLSILKTILWRLRFVAPLDDAMNRMALAESKIEAVQTMLALKQNIATGSTDAALEQRIAALPPDQRTEVETVRRQLQDAKKQQLAKALEEQETQERALRRQRLIDEAISLRKEEIETGKPNPTAEAQRRSDTELKQAVEQWETTYRQEQAERKAEEARRRVAEAERAKAEAEQHRQAEAMARQQQQEKARREAVLRQYDVRATILGHQLQANPFRGVRFQRMIERQVGIFLTMQEQEIIVSSLPVEMFSTPGQSTPMIVRVRGVTPVTNRIGAVFEVPHVEYLTTP
jgi:chemotaxis protein histidine kinase CheA